MLPRLNERLPGKLDLGSDNTRRSDQESSARRKRLESRRGWIRAHALITRGTNAGAISDRISRSFPETEGDEGGRECFRMHGRRAFGEFVGRGGICAIAIVPSQGRKGKEAGRARRSRSCPRAMIIIMRCPTPAIFEGRPAPLLPYWAARGSERRGAGKRGEECTCINSLRALRRGTARRGAARRGARMRAYSPRTLII